MPVRIKKVIAKTSKTIFTGKGINKPSSGEIKKLILDNITITGAGNGTIDISLKAEDFKNGARKTFTLISGAPVYKGAIINLLPKRLNFTDSYDVIVNSTTNLTVMLEYSISSDTAFVTDFEANN